VELIFGIRAGRICPSTTNWPARRSARSWPDTSRARRTWPMRMPGPPARSASARPPAAWRHEPGHRHRHGLHGQLRAGGNHGPGLSPAHRQRRFQEVDTTGITIPITKHNYLVQDGDELSRTVAEAFYLAGSARPGPVLIDVPKDVLLEQCTPDDPEPPQLEGYRPTLKGTPARSSVRRQSSRLPSAPSSSWAAVSVLRHRTTP